MSTEVLSLPVHHEPELEEKFKSSNYFNYFKKLETGNTHLNFGLVPSSRYSSIQFKLVDFNIESTIKDQVVDSSFHLKYTNGDSSPVEAKYILPLPPTSTVYDMKVEYDGKVLVGKIKEKVKAQNIYSDSIASGGQGFMAERQENGHFVLSLGNVPPGKDVDIKVKIIGELASHLENLHYFLHRFYFPTTNFNFDLKLNIHMNGGIDDIFLLNGGETQPKVKYEVVDGKKVFAAVSLKLTNQGGNNLIFVIKPSTTQKPLPAIEYNEKDKTYATAINFYPSFESIDPMDIDQKSEFIFLVDCSGSMSGEPIKKAKSALEIIVRGLSESVKFNIYCFGSGFKKMFPTSQLYNDATLQQASNHIKTIDANLGGTELLGPIKDILQSPYDQEYPKQVFIFTDGEVDDRDGLIDFVSKESYVRLFTYGIGTGVDRQLITGLSRACKGYFEFINDVKDMEAKVMKLFNIAMEPTISNVKVDWNGFPFTQTPAIVRPIFNGERLTIYGLTESGVSDFKDNTVTLTGTSPKGETLTFKIPLEFSNASNDSKSIHTLAGYSIIRDLCEEEKKKNNDSLHLQRVVQIGKKYGIVSKHTSYVVTNESKEVTTETMKDVQVNANTTEPNTTTITPGGVSRNIAQISSIPQDDLDECEEQEEYDDYVGNVLGDTPDCISQQQDRCLESYSEPMELLKEDISFSQKSIKPASSSSGILNSFTSLFKSKQVSSPPPPPPPTTSQSSRISMPTPILSQSSHGPMPTPVSSQTLSPPISYQSPISRGEEKPTPVSSQTLSPPISYQPPISRGEEKPTSNVLLRIISAQSANGSFNQSNLPFSISIPIPNEISTLLDVWIAICVLEKLKKDHQNEKDQWSLTASKATKFIRSILIKEGKIDLLSNLQAIASK